MVYAIVFAVFMTVICVWCLYPRKIVHLRKFGIKDDVFKKLNTEIGIFNKMRIKLPKQRRQPNLYIKWLGRLHVNPSERVISADPIEKLLYLYACAKLYTMTRDEFRKRQYHKNIIYGFARPIKKRVMCFRPLKLSPRILYAIRQPHFKYLQTKFVARDPGVRFSHSYIVAGNVKNYVTETDGHPIDCHDITGKHRFEFDTCMDKMKCAFSHTNDAFFCTYQNRAVAVLVQGVQRINFETNLAGADANLSVYINLKNGGAIRVIHTDTKANAMRIVGRIKGAQRLNYLLTPYEIECNTRIEDLYMRSYLSTFVAGEKLKQRAVTAAKYLPTIYLPTIVHDIDDAQELFGIIDNFENFKKIVRAGVNLNVVVMYSSQNDTVREFIGAFTNRRDAIQLVRAGVFLFFIDKVRTHNDAVYYFSKMLDASQNKLLSSNAGKKDDLYIFSRKNVSYSITNPRTGVTKYYRLKPGENVLDEFGRVIDIGYDAICRSVKIATAKQKTTAKKVLTDAKNVVRRRELA